MLSSITVRNFQSLRDVTVELGALTVVVGASSSGKSAFGRATRMLASNARGSSFITHGESVCTVEATTDRGRVILRKTRGTDDAYTIVPEDPEEQQRTFTKLGGAVPPEVSDFLAIAPKDAINFADQFDRPYLLDDTGNEVARTLGELTGVSIVLEAAREARRDQLAQSGTLKTRRSDLAESEGQVEQFRGLRGQREALERAEETIRTAGATEASLALIDGLVGSLREDSALLKGMAEVPEPPSRERIEEARETARLLERLNALAEEASGALPTLHTEPPSTEEAKSLAASLATIEAHADALIEDLKIVKQHQQIIADAEEEVSNLVAEREALIAEVGDPKAFQSVSTWLEARGSFGESADAKTEHQQTIDAMKERS